MSRMAQELQRQIDELQRARRSGRRPKLVELDGAASTDVTNGTEPSEVSESRRSMETKRLEETMARQRAAKRSAIAKQRKAKNEKTITKRASGSRADRAPISLPSVGELRLEPNGVRAEKKNRYINLYFTNGLIVRLQPANLSSGDVLRVRDLMVEWLSGRT